jgi:transposase
MPKSIQLKRRIPIQFLEAKLKTESNRRLRDRLQTIQWVASGVPVQEVAKRIGRCRQVVSAFIHRFNREGVTGLLRIGRGPGRQSRLTSAQWAEVAGWIQRGPREEGHPFSNWDCKRLAVCIHRKWRVRLSDEQVRRQLHHLGCRLLRPTHALPGRDPRDRAKKKELWRFCWLAPGI